MGLMVIPAVESKGNSSSGVIHRVVMAAYGCSILQVEDESVTGGQLRTGKDEAIRDDLFDHYVHR